MSYSSQVASKFGKPATSQQGTAPVAGLSASQRVATLVKSGQIKQPTVAPVVAPTPSPTPSIQPVKQPSPSVLTTPAQPSIQPMAGVKIQLDNTGNVVGAPVTPEPVKKPGYIDQAISSIQNKIVADPENNIYQKLADAQSFFENKLGIGKKANIQTGIVKGVAGTLLGSSQQVQDTMYKRFVQPVTDKEKTFDTVGQGVGSVLTMVAGGSVLKGIGLTKMMLPTLFATLGQTSAEPGTTLTQRALNLPIDATTGYIFSLLPLPTSLKNVVKGTLGAYATITPTQFIKELTKGRSKEEALKIANQAGQIAALFYGVGSTIGLFTGQRQAKFNKTVTPEEIRQAVYKRGAEKTAQGKDLLNVAYQAETQGKNVNYSTNTVRQSILDDILGRKSIVVGTGETKTNLQGIKQTTMELVDPPTKIGETPTTPTTPAVTTALPATTTPAAIEPIAPITPAVPIAPPITPATVTPIAPKVPVEGVKPPTGEPTKPPEVVEPVTTKPAEISTKVVEPSGEVVKFIEARLKSTFPSRDINSQKKSFLTTDGEIVGVGNGNDAHYDFFNKDNTSMDKYLESGGIRINKNDSVKYPGYAIEIHQPPTTNQLQQLLSLPDNVNYNYDFYRKGKPSLSSDIVTNDKANFVKNLEDYYPEIKNQFTKEEELSFTARKFDTSEKFIDSLGGVPILERSKYLKLWEEANPKRVAEMVAEKEANLAERARSLELSKSKREEVAKTRLARDVEMGKEKIMSEIKNIESDFEAIAGRGQKMTVDAKISGQTGKDENKMDLLIKRKGELDEALREIEQKPEVKAVKVEKQAPPVVTTAPKVAPKPLPTTPKPAKKVSAVVFKPGTLSKSLKLQKTTIPVLSGAVVKDGRLTMSNLEETISLKTDKPNGWYRIVGEDLVKGTDEMIAEFPDGLIPSDTKPAFTTLIEDFTTNIDLAKNQVAKDTIRPILTGINITVRPSGISLDSTDGFRLYHKEMPAKSEATTSFIIPAENLSKMVKLLGSGKVQVTDNQDFVKFSNDNGEYVTHKLIGNFPDIAKVYPNFKKTIVLDKAEMRSAIKEIAPYSKMNSGMMGIKVGEKEITLVGKDANDESAVKEVKIKIQRKNSIDVPKGIITEGTLVMPINSTENNMGENIDFILNYRYVDDALKSLENDSIHLNTVEDVKDLMPVQFVDKVSTAKEPAKSVSNGGASASMGGYADLQNLTNATDLKVIEMPEMVRLATELMGRIPEIKLPRGRAMFGGARPYGLFHPAGKGKITLNPEMFKDVGQAAKTLAHEMGHLADYLPTHTMARGNLIGRIATLNKFMRETFSGLSEEQRVDELISQRDDLRLQRANLKDEEGNVSDKALDMRILTELKTVNKDIKNIRDKVEIKNKEVKTELSRLSLKWKPINKEEWNMETLKMDTTPMTLEEVLKNEKDDFINYRLSPPELYADAVSVLFNDPALLQKEAPIFFEKFFKYLDQKPEMKQGFNDLQTLLHAGNDEVMAQRLSDLDKDYKKGEELFLAKETEAQNQKFNLMRSLDTLFINKDAALIRKADQLMKQGKVLDPATNPIYTQGGLNYLEGGTKNFIANNYQPSVIAVEDVPNGWNELGKILQLERAIYERGELANPHGYDPKTAQDTLDALEKKIGESDWNKLQEGKKIFRDATQELLKLAEEEGYYKPELIKQMKANPAYATFQVLDYLDTHISSKISHQVGTLKGVSNPATASVMKAVSTYKAIQYNKAKKSNLEFMKEQFGDEIQPAKYRFTGRGREAMQPKDKELSLVLVVEDGTMKGYYVNKDVGAVLNNVREETLAQLGKVSRILTQAGLYRPLFTSINLGFQIFNLKKDFDRTWRNMPDETLGQAIMSLPTLAKDYISSAPSAWRSALGKSDQIIKEMEDAKILGLTHNDMYGDPDPGDEQITRELRKIGALPPEDKVPTTMSRALSPVVKLFDGIKIAGDFIERLPKIAGYKRLKDTMADEELANYIRNYIGSPDFKTYGTATGITNNILMFSNAAKEGIIGDIKMSTRPKTRSGWWFKMMIQAVLPKLLLLATAMGLLGKDKKKELAGVSEYDKTNYDIVTMGLDENGKTIYVRVPKDESARLIGSMVWKIGNFFSPDKKQKLITNLMDIFSIYAGQLPNVAPSWTGINALITYLSGKNPYDSFRNRNIIPDQEFSAGFKYSFPIFLKWLSANQGLNVVLPSYTPEGNMTTLEKILNLPVLSNILGRFVKVSDYGKVEQSREMTKELATESAGVNLEKRKKIDEAVKSFLEGDPTKKDQGVATGDLIKSVLGKVPETKEEIALAKQIDKKFRLGLIVGKYNTDVDNVVESTTNQAKAENLMVLYKATPSKEFNDLMVMMRDQGVVTEDTEKKFQDLLSAPPKKKSEGFSLVKKAHAQEGEMITIPEEEAKNNKAKAEKKYSGIETNAKEKPVVTIFDEYDLPREVIFGIASAEGGKIGSNNIFNIGAYDSDPGAAINYKSPEEGALAVAKLLSGTFTKADGRVDTKYKEAYDNRDNPAKMLEMIQDAGYAGDPATWKKRSADSGGAGLYYDSWSEFIMDTQGWKKWSGEKGATPTINEVKPTEKPIYGGAMITEPTTGRRYPAKYKNPNLLDYTKKTKNDRYYS